VTHHGKPVHVPSKTFDVLAALLQRAGRLVTKRQLLECVWGDVCVEPGIRTVHVAALRKLLGESIGEARFIETVSGYGYRFVADVRCAEGSADCSVSSRLSPHPRVGDPRSRVVNSL
jgi:DNA-binding winged helix-turn-helix (wHTH) protein